MMLKNLKKLFIGNLVICALASAFWPGGLAAKIKAQEANDVGISWYDDMVSKSLIQTGNNERVKKAIEKAENGEDVTIAYLGGSITQGLYAKPQETKCYAYLSYQYFKETYGKDGGDNVHYVNAGIGGTPSSLGMLRYERDVLKQGDYEKTESEYPDILFIEFAVNDSDDAYTKKSYESIIRTALNAPNKPAVILLYSVFNYEPLWNLQDNYIPLGKYYELPMISIKDAIKDYVNKEEYLPYKGGDGFFDDNVDKMHPTTYGHQIMADCINYAFGIIDGQEKDEPIEAIPEEPINEGSELLTDMKFIDCSTINEEDVTIDVGSFIHEDKDIAQFQMNQGWRHSSADDGAEPFVLTLTCKNLYISYKRTDKRETEGAVRVLIDGEEIHTKDEGGIMKALDAGNGGWNNAWTAALLDDQTEEARHTIEIYPVDESKGFSILGFGYNKNVLEPEPEPTATIKPIEEPTSTPSSIPTTTPNLTQTSAPSVDNANVSVPAPSKPVKLKSAYKGKKVLLTWKKVSSANGYEVQVSGSRKFKKQIKIKYTAKTKCSLKKMKRNKKCYVRIRAYVNNNGKIIPGKWSRIKVIKFKK